MTFDEWVNPNHKAPRRRPMEELLRELKCPHCGEPVPVFPATPVSSSVAGAYSQRGRGALVPARTKETYL